MNTKEIHTYTSEKQPLTPDELTECFAAVSAVDDIIAPLAEDNIEPLLEAAKNMRNTQPKIIKMLEMMGGYTHAGGITAFYSSIIKAEITQAQPEQEVCAADIKSTVDAFLSTHDKPIKSTSSEYVRQRISHPDLFTEKHMQQFMIGYRITEAILRDAQKEQI